jgi:hypothetical protein
MLERDRLQCYADALVTGRSSSMNPTSRVVCSHHYTTAGCEQDKRRPHELETLGELIEKEVKLTAWGRSVKRQNGLGKKNRGPTPSDSASPSAAVDKKGSEEGEDDGDTRQGRG